jgi:hypothetical protein
MELEVLQEISMQVTNVLSNLKIEIRKKALAVRRKTGTHGGCRKGAGRKPKRKGPVESEQHNKRSKLHEYI